MELHHKGAGVIMEILINYILTNCSISLISFEVCSIWW